MTDPPKGLWGFGKSLNILHLLNYGTYPKQIRVRAVRVLNRDTSGNQWDKARIGYLNFLDFNAGQSVVELAKLLDGNLDSNYRYRPISLTVILT